MITGDHAKEADIGAVFENAGISSGITHSAAKVNAAEIAPCSSLPMMYGARLNPASAVIAMTWICTQSPEKPTMNEVSTSFSMVGMSSCDVIIVPVENSQIPDASAPRSGGSGSRSSSVRDRAEKNMIEKHTVMMLCAARESEVENTSVSGISRVISRMGGELW